jgi:hypothetical protein
MEKVCTKCNQMKPIEDYGINRAYKTNTEPVCKVCRRKIQKGYRVKKHKKITNRGTLRMSNTTKEDWCRLYMFLGQIGYDTNEDIHKQFVEKYGLEYKERPIKNLIPYRSEDCIGFNFDD